MDRRAHLLSRAHRAEPPVSRHYGHDVTTWHGFELLRDIRELRMTCYLAQHTTEHPCTHSEAELRVACLRGDHGPRPWNWTPTLGSILADLLLELIQKPAGRRRRRSGSTAD